jgi:LPS-assembly lipoprotein
MQRRTFLLSSVAAALAGCGFELRRAPELHFKAIQLSGFKPQSPLAGDLRRALQSVSATRVVEAASLAEVVLESLNDVREKGVVSSGTAGQVLEVQLRSRFSFRLRTPMGKELIPASEILLTRDMTYNESIALAKEHEETLLYRAMETDIASQVLRRLASVQSL